MVVHVTYPCHLPDTSLPPPPSRYPIGVAGRPGTPSGGWVPVRVNAVTRDFVELDGNCEIEGRPVQVHVDVVDLSEQ